jgi:CRP-like cAMP-binding protein
MLLRAGVFKALPERACVELAAFGRRRLFAPDVPLMRQGEPATCMHLILRGRVRVERSHPALLDPLPLAELGEGATVGELGLLDGAPRSATVIALEETETVELDAQALAATLLRYPRAAETLLQTLSRRLRSVDELAAQLQHKAHQEGAA